MENGKLNIKTIAFYILHFTFYISLLGCAVKTTPVYAVIKTPQIKVADQGFLQKAPGYKKLTVYKAANVPVEITVKNSSVCVNSKCMDKKRFAQNYLPRGYPADFLDKILEKKCPKGFFCKTDKNRIFFKDRKNGIVIMIKEIGNGF